jgi:hypothetical protein
MVGSLSFFHPNVTRNGAGACLEKELLALADNEERLHGLLAPEPASNGQNSAA